MSKFEQILGTTKDETEKWNDVLTRLNKAGSLDVKTLAKLVFAIMEILDEKK